MSKSIKLNSDIVEREPNDTKTLMAIGQTISVQKTSELDYVIPPEIKDDEFYYLIQKLAKEENIRTVLEIGSSAGGGSTEAFVKGLRENPNRPELYCMEVSKPRFIELERRYTSNSFVKCYNVSSVSLDKFPTEKELADFYNSTRTALNTYQLDTVVGWLRQDIEYVRSSGVPVSGIQRIKSENNVSHFDMVLIDGSEFTGAAELEEVYGAKLILLDDINGFKNYSNYQRLMNDHNYCLIKENWNVRNGYAVFKKKESALPIHFFTIVLNGEPFIRHHIDVFRQLPLNWHWHIIEGVAELKHDTAWSLQFGGRITNELHRAGLSNDGTTEYLDELARQFPENITIYRKSKGAFWDGKLEMVNAPLVNIKEECLLFQVDADELWSVDQITMMNALFTSNPGKTAAFFHCYYFVGPKKYVSSINTWATYPNDWIRVWRFKLGMHWSTHEPPLLVDAKGANVGLLNPFTRDETMTRGITFQHFAYATEAQVRFKEIYYGYTGALLHWRNLQKTTGPVNPAAYLPWARMDAVVDDWPTLNGPLLSGRLLAGTEKPKSYSSMSVDGETQFETELRKLFFQIRPTKIIETGTYMGQGTSSIIWRAICDFHLDADFTTIEVNPTHYQLAIQHFQMNNMRIRAELGLSIPRAMLPDEEEITDKFIRNKEYEGIYYDHKVSERAHLYFSETNHDVPDNLLYTTMERYEFRPDFVLLDSAGHMGFAEFKYFLDLIKDSCYLMLDDIYHCKHFKTLQYIKSDPRFTILVESPEKFGFCIIRYTHVKSLVFIRTDSIGDNVLASSMLPYIRKKYPDAKITILCQDHISELYRASPFVDNVVGFDRSKALDNNSYRDTILKQLQALNTDLVLNTAYSREPLTDLFAIGSGGKERIAFNGDLCNINANVRNANNPLYTRLLPSEANHKPELERHRDFLKGLSIDAPPLQPIAWTTTEDEQFAENYFNTNNLIPAKTMALFICGQWEGKKYEHYTEALIEICRENDLAIIAFGSESDREIAQRILNTLDASFINLAGETTLRQTAALLRRCCLGVGADTGTAHIACAVGTPNVILLGGGHFGRFLPYSPLTSVVCLPLECYNCNWQCRYNQVHCIKDIDPKVIAEAVRQTLELKSGKPRVFVQGSSLWDAGLQRPKWRWFNEYLDTDTVEIIPVGVVPSIPRPAIEQYKKSQEFIAAGKLDEAISTIENLLEISPDYALAHNDLGVLYYKKGDNDRSLSHYEKAARLNPDNIIFQKNLADLYYHLGQVEEALQIYLNVLSGNPQDIETLLALGNICIAQNRNEDAMTFYNRVMEIEPDNKETVLNISQIMKEIGQVEQALNLCYVYLARNPVDKEVRELSEALANSNVKRKNVFRESKLAHELLDCLKGLEVGPSSHNPFGLNTRNVGLKFEGYEKEQMELAGEITPLDIIAPADDIPVEDESEDFVLSSHVIEHCPNMIKTLVEWYRIVKKGGYIYMIVPHREAAPSDRGRPLTDWQHILDDYKKNTNETSEPEAGSFGYCHYHVFDFITINLFMHNIFGNRLILTHFQERDDKIGNGFTLVYKKVQSLKDSFPWLLDGNVQVEVVNKVDEDEGDDHQQKIVISANLVPFKDQGQVERQERCTKSIDTLVPMGILPLNICYENEYLQPSGWNVISSLKRSADLELGVSGKRKPFVPDLMNLACEWAKKEGVEWFAYTNNDIIITPKLINEVRRLIRNGYETIAVSRNEVQGIDEDGGLIPGYLEYKGFDVFFYYVGWWERNRDLFQPYILGERAWDDAYTSIMMAHSKGMVLYIDGLCFHFKHPTTWLEGPYSEYNMALYLGPDKAYQNKIGLFFYMIGLIGLRRLTKERLDNLINDSFKANRFIKYVNICMISYNRIEFTRQSIASVLKWTDFPYVLTIVDNNSQDGTKEYLKELKNKGIINNLILLDENVGVAKASNLAWSLEPDAEYYMKLDNDIIIQKPDWLTNMIRVIDAVPQIGAIGYNFEPGTYPVYEINGHKVRVKARGNLGGACILIPKRTKKILGYWCEDYGLYGEEDADYGVRISIAGLLNAYMEDDFIGFHLPAGRAAQIDLKTFVATDGLEEISDKEYREWKDAQRRKNISLLRSNIKRYQKDHKEIYIDSKFNPSNTKTDKLASAVCKTSESGDLKEVDKAASSMMSGKREDMLSTWRIVSERGNRDISDQESQGNAAYQDIQPLITAGRHDDALVALEKLVKTFPGYALAHNDLGVLYFNRGDRERALAHYENAAWLNPENITFQKNLADFYFVVLDRVEDALKIYLKILDKHPSDTETLLALGQICTSLNRIDDARFLFGRVLEIEPQNITAIQGIKLLQDNLITQTNNEGTSSCSPESSYQDTFKLKREVPVSIVILTFNSSKTITKCLQSVANTLRPDDELFIVDNASTDSTVQVVKTIIKGKPSFTLVKNGKNLGFSAGTNVGIDKCRNPYVVLLNPDTVVSEGWIDRLLFHFNDSRVGAVGPVSDYVAGMQKMGLYQKDQIPSDASTDAIGQKFYQWNKGRSVETKLLIGFCMAVRRDIFQALGMLDEELFLGNDDLELSWRLRLNGYILKVATDTFIHHEGQQSFNTVKKETTNRLVQESTDALYSKLQAHYGQDNVPTPEEIWGMNWFNPTSVRFNPSARLLDRKSIISNLTSIVILTFNQLKYTKECVESICKHTPEPHEIIFVDNGSTDGTVKWLRQLIKENGNYKLIENKKNLGFAKGCNQGISASSGEYILLLNNDVVVTDGWLSGMLECLNSSADIGIVGPMTNNISGPQKVENVDYKSTDQVNIYAKSFKERNRHRRIPIRRIVGFCMLFKRELVDKIGLLDECFGTGNFEDDDYCLRAALEGYRNMVAGDVFIHHYGSITFIGNRIDFDYGSLMGKNKDIFSKKWSGIDVNSSIGKRLIALKAMEKADELNQTGQLDKAVDHILQEGLRYSPDDRRLYFAIAEILIDAKDFKGALDTINEMPGGDEDIKKLVLTGYCKQGMGQDDEAEQYADRALSLDPHSSLALNLKGIIAHKKGKLDAAEAFFNKSIESDNGYGEPYTNLGVMRWDAGEENDGLDLLEKGVILSPKVTDSINLYHSAITETGEFERAEKLFRELKPFYPMNKTVSFLLIDSLIKQGKNSAAMQETENAIVAFGVDDGMLGAALELRNNLGPHKTSAYADGRNSVSLCMIVKNEEQHIAKCLMSLKPIVDEIIIVDTGSTDRTKGIATAFGAKVFDFPWTGNFSDARNFSLSKASGQWIFVMDADEVISPLDYPAFNELAKKTKHGGSAFKFVTRNYITSVNIDTWNPNDGRYILEEAGAGWVPSDKVRLFPNNMEIRFENPVHEMVEPSLKRLKIPAREVAIPVHHYGKLSAEKSREKGEQYYLLGKKKLEETGGNLDAICELAIQAGELERYDEALELWQKAINIAPNLPVAFMNMGHIYLQKGDFKDSLAASRMAMKLKPDYWEAISNYAIGELCGGNIKESISTLEDLMRKNQKYLLGLGVLSAAYCCDGRKEKGLECFSRLNQEQVAFSGLLSGLAKQLIAAGRVEYATLLLEAAVESNNINADIPGLLAECYHRVGSPHNTDANKFAN